MTQFNRRDVLKRMGLGLAAAAGGGVFELTRRCGAAGRRGDHLNVILFHIDDLGWKDLGCQGSRYYETPNIDRLASQGVRFTDAYAACAVCSPTRAALMTGRYPARHGVTDWIRARFQGGDIPPDHKNPDDYIDGKNRKLLCPENHLWMESDEVTIAEALEPAGYVSCHIGKWHLGAEPWWPGRQGFDYNVGGCDYGQPPNYFDPYCRKGQGCIPTLERRKEGEYLTDREADEAVAFIQKYKNRPFFLQMAHYGVHTPIQGKEGLVEKYKNKPKYGQKNPTYAAMVESIDHSVGQILDTVEKLGLTENTLVIFTSDNGGLSNVTNNDPLRAGKGWPYEGGIRVPLIIRYPGVTKPGTVSHEPVTSVDYLPTILDAAGQPLPSGRAIDGESLLGRLASGGQEPLDRDAIFWHFPHYRGGRIGPYSIVRAGRWKLLKWWEGPKFELYDLENDLGEENDLADEKPEKVRELRARLDQWLEMADAKLPRPNPDYQGS